MLYFVAVTVAVLVLLYAMPVTVSMDIDRAGQNDKITIEVKTLYGLLKFRSDIPFLELLLERGKPSLKYRVKLAGKKRNRLIAQFAKVFSPDDRRKLLDIIKAERQRILSALSYLAEKTTISKFRLRITLGTGDAAETSILYGLVWIIIGNIMTFTGRFITIREPRIKVIPLFDQIRLSIDLNCIFSIRLGHIINTGIRVIAALLSYKRNKNKN